MSRDQEPRHSLPPIPEYEVTIIFAAGYPENIPRSSTLRMDNGWVFVTDRIQAPDNPLSKAGKGYVSRTRAFPPGSIQQIVTIREDLD